MTAYDDDEDAGGWQEPGESWEQEDDEFEWLGADGYGDCDRCHAAKEQIASPTGGFFTRCSNAECPSHRDAPG